MGSGEGIAGRCGEGIQENVKRAVLMANELVASSLRLSTAAIYGHRLGASVQRAQRTVRGDNLAQALGYVGVAESDIKQLDEEITSRSPGADQ